MKRFLCIATAMLPLLATGTLNAQVIPADRIFAGGWRNAGRTQPIPDPTLIVNVHDYGATGLGLVNEQAAIQSAINAVNAAGGGVVYLPAGTYLINSSLSLRANTVLRGERAHNTEIVITNVPASQVHGINVVQNSQPHPWINIQSGYNIHSDTVTLTNVSSFAAGNWVETRVGTNAAWKMSSWANDAVGQILQVAEVTVTEAPAGALRFVTPLRFQHTSGLFFSGVEIPARIRRITPIENVGIENLKISRTIAGTNASRNNTYSLYFRYAANFWVRGCEFTNVFGAGIGLDYSANGTISGNYIHDAYEHDGGGSGYGVVMTYKTSEVLVENNIFRYLRHSMLAQAGVNGNVFGYNYSREAYSTDHADPTGGPINYAGDISIHGNYPYGNLFEGNIVQHIWIDNSHGANGPHNLYFRNLSELCGFYMTQPDSHRQSVVGNELFDPKINYSIFGFTILKLDGYTFQGSDHFTYGNNHETLGNQPPATGDLSDYSYYLGTSPAQPPPEPEWWTLESTLPVIGPPHALAPAKSIPASARWFSGGTLTYAPPSLYQQPTNQTAQQGDTASFAIAAAGTPDITVQWFLDDVLLPTGTNAVLTIEPVDLPDEGVYRARISDDGGSVWSATATLTVERVFFAVETAISGAGTISPDGIVLTAYGTLTNFTITADPYHHIASIHTNETPVPGVSNLTEYALSWGPAFHTGSIAVAFAPDLTSQGVPHEWLASHGFEGTNFNRAAEEDWDSDGHSNWMEFLAGTDPTNTLSVFQISESRFESDAGLDSEWTLEWPSVSGRVYSIWLATNLNTGFQPLATHLTADPPLNSYTYTNPPPTAFFRLALE